MVSFTFHFSLFFFVCRADWNDDSLLTLQELAKFINRRICDHIEQAIRSNPIDFSEIDRAPRNGLVTWDEYYSHFLKTRGYNDEFIKHVDRARHTQLDRKSKEQIVKDKLMWNEAARTESYSLTLDEFLAFRHPGKMTAKFRSECIFIVSMMSIISHFCLREQRLVRQIC